MPVRPAIPSGFYDIPALAPAVDAFFVMQYQPEPVRQPVQRHSPLTSRHVQRSDHRRPVRLAAVPASKVILGLPYFGIDWPTTNGTLTAHGRRDPRLTPSLRQIVSSGHPVYWDPITQTLRGRRTRWEPSGMRPSLKIRPLFMKWRRWPPRATWPDLESGH